MTTSNSESVFRTNETLVATIEKRPNGSFAVLLYGPEEQFTMPTRPGDSGGFVQKPTQHEHLTYEQARALVEEHFQNPPSGNVQ